jgi:capsid protein
VKNARGKFDEAANEKLEDAWYDWGRAGECEITGKWSFNTVQRLLCRIWATDGELLVRRCAGPTTAATASACS